MILPAHEANRLLHEAGIPVVSARIADSLEEAARDAEDLGYPVALKLSSSRYTHKTDIGGIFLNLRDRRELEAAYGKLVSLRSERDPEARIVTEPMVSPGMELFIGIQSHPQFGPVMSTGLGGILLELIPDVSFRLLPARRADFAEMLSELRSWAKLRKGFRHFPAADEEQVLDFMERVARFALDHPDVRELDLNPVVLLDQGALVLDATIVTDFGQASC